ncbi:MAG: ArgE/DapE family deacylase [Chloroflexota bacterium]|nr:ArgE/DapE family deacylase [Chloroflexota bacterium]
MTDNRIYDRALERVDALRDELVSRLQELVRIPSVTGHEHDVQQAVSRQMDDLGLDIDMWEPDAAELAPFAEHVGAFESLAGRPNVVGTRKGSGGGRSLIVNAHIDTVEPGDRSHWTVDPFGGEVIDGKLYGRGSCDMKAGLVAPMIALRALDEAGIVLSGDVLIESVISEEDGGAGALASILRGHRADACVITEPTELAIIPAQGGSLVFRLTIEGRSAHACVRNEGISALEKFLPIHAALLRHEREHHEAIDHPLYSKFGNRAPINIGTVAAGNWPSSVPESIVVEGRAGLVPGESLDQTREAFVQAVMDACTGDSWLEEHPPRIEWFSGQFAAAEVPGNHPLVEALAEAHRRSSGNEVAIDGATYGADMRHFINAGNMPCIMYGPGDVRRAHRPDEFVPVDEVLAVARTLTVMMLDWCGIHYAHGG